MKSLTALAICFLELLSFVSIITIFGWHRGGIIVNAVLLMVLLGILGITWRVIVYGRSRTRFACDRCGAPVDAQGVHYVGDQRLCESCAREPREESVRSAPKAQDTSANSEPPQSPGDASDVTLTLGTASRGSIWPRLLAVAVLACILCACVLGWFAFGQRRQANGNGHDRMQTDRIELASPSRPKEPAVPAVPASGSSPAPIRVMTPEADSWTPLHHAALRGEMAKVRQLVNEGADVNAKSVLGKTPLHEAAWSGHGEIVAFLLGHGAVIDAKMNNGTTPLHWAVQHCLFNSGEHREEEDRQLIRLLISKGADLQAADSKGRTPLSLAVAEGDTELTDLLRKAATELQPSGR